MGDYDSCGNSARRLRRKSGKASFPGCNPSAGIVCDAFTRIVETLNDYDSVVTAAAGEKTIAEWAVGYVLLGAQFGK